MRTKKTEMDKIKEDIDVLDGRVDALSGRMLAYDNEKASVSREEIEEMRARLEAIQKQAGRLDGAVASVTEVANNNIVATDGRIGKVETRLREIEEKSEAQDDAIADLGRKRCDTDVYIALLVGAVLAVGIPIVTKLAGCW